MCMPVCDCVYVSEGVHRARFLRAGITAVNHLAWILGTEPRFFAKAVKVSSLLNLVGSPLRMFFFKEHVEVFCLHVSLCTMCA